MRPGVSQCCRVSGCASRVLVPGDCGEGEDSLWELAPGRREPRCGALSPEAEVDDPGDLPSDRLKAQTIDAVTKSTVRAHTMLRRGF
jgi:hypothetical protein